MEVCGRVTGGGGVNWIRPHLVVGVAGDIGAGEGDWRDLEKGALKEEELFKGDFGKVGVLGVFGTESTRSMED